MEQEEVLFGRGIGYIGDLLGWHEAGHLCARDNRHPEEGIEVKQSRGGGNMGW